jgi:excinuclease ABC subunit C
MDKKEAIKGLPASSGVYIMKGAAGAVLYVGKAANVRKRVSSYFYPNRRLYGRLDSMVAQVERIDCVPTVSEAEALVYENSLIKQLKPKYNVLLRDDKSYPRLKLTVNEDYPRLFITRRKMADGALYFGPYTNGRLLHEALVAIRQMFPLRSCGRMGRKACLNYHLRQCLAPCELRIAKADYAEIVSQLAIFLEKGRPGLVGELGRRMLEASKAEDFERAAKLRARIEALSSMREDVVRYLPADEAAELGRMLSITAPLETIEAFDVSDMSGQEAAGSMVLFFRGRPRKGEYRKFRIRTVSGADDYAMMREIVRRRYERQLAEKKRLPDLIVIDGGKGHLAAAAGELEALGLSAVPAIGIAKAFEHIYLKGAGDPLVLPRDSKALHLLERIRDEAHRFAIAYHKGLRAKKVGSSELDDIAGVGEKRKRLLLETFGSVGRISSLSVEELKAAGGIDEKTAKNIVDHFKR